MKKVLICLFMFFNLLLTGCVDSDSIQTDVVTSNQKFDITQLRQVIEEKDLTTILETEVYYQEDGTFSYSLFKNIDEYISIFEECGLILQEKVDENILDVQKLSEESGMSYSIYKYWHDENYQYLLKTNDNFSSPISSIEITPMYDNNNELLLNKGFRRNEDGGYTKYYPFGEIHLIEDDKYTNVYTSFNFMLLDYYDDGLNYYITEVKDTLEKMNVNNVSEIILDLEKSLTANLQEDINSSSYVVYSEMTDTIEQIKETEILIYK